MIRMKFEGGAEIAAELRKMSDRASKGVLREALRTVSAPPIQRSASASAPRSAGAPDIADNIVISTGRASGANEAAIVVGPSTGTRTDRKKPLRYDTQGVYLEFGTSDTQMKAFMRPAFDQEAERTLGPLAGALWRAIISGGGSTTRSSGGGGGLL